MFIPNFPLKIRVASPERIPRQPLINYSQLYTPQIYKSHSTQYILAQEQEIGNGSYGSVKLVRDQQSGILYAMKIVLQSDSFLILEISKQITKYYNAEENIRQEIILQSKLNYEHILKLIEYFEDDINIYIILEYCQKGNLFQYLSVKRILSEQEAFGFFYQILKGLDYLHSFSIVHRDIKPENILLDQDNNVKICDFNWAIKLQKGYAADPILCGTTEYMPPEVVLNQRHSFGVDIWSLGILLYVIVLFKKKKKYKKECLHGDVPFRGNTQEQKIESILCNKNFSIKNYLSLDLQILLFQMLSRIEEQRPNVKMILKNKWVQNQLKSRQRSSSVQKQMISQPSGFRQITIQNSKSVEKNQTPLGNGHYGQMYLGQNNMAQQTNLFQTMNFQAEKHYSPMKFFEQTNITPQFQKFNLNLPQTRYYNGK